MKQIPSEHLREDVLDAFTVEPDHERATLEHYLRTYPKYAEDLVDLSRELSRVSFEDEEPLSTEDQTLIDAAWKSHCEAAPQAATDPLADLSASDLREISKRLDVPRQIVTAFRERRVLVSSVPRRFLALFATTVNCAFERFVDALALPPTERLARSFKADTKPEEGGSVTFEQLLIEAGVPEEKRSALLTDID